MLLKPMQQYPCENIYVFMLAFSLIISQKMLDHHKGLSRRLVGYSLRHSFIFIFYNYSTT